MITVYSVIYILEYGAYIVQLFLGVEAPQLFFLVVKTNFTPYFGLFLDI